MPTDPVPGDVLVVDDDPDMVEVIRLVLGQADYRTRGAENGKQALQAVEERLPSLVLLDMLMPIMSGWQCAKELRATYGRQLPIVVMTAAEHARARSDEVEADDVLSKPFEIAELLRVVAKHVGPADPRRRSGDQT